MTYNNSIYRGQYNGTTNSTARIRSNTSSRADSLVKKNKALRNQYNAVVTYCNNKIMSGDTRQNISNMKANISSLINEENGLIERCNNNIIEVKQKKINKIKLQGKLKNIIDESQKRIENLTNFSQSLTQKMTNGTGPKGDQEVESREHIEADLQKMRSELKELNAKKKELESNLKTNKSKLEATKNSKMDNEEKIKKYQEIELFAKKADNEYQANKKEIKALIKRIAKKKQKLKEIDTRNNQDYTPTSNTEKSNTVSDNKEFSCNKLENNLPVLYEGMEISGDGNIIVDYSGKQLISNVDEQELSETDLRNHEKPIKLSPDEVLFIKLEIYARLNDTLSEQEAAGLEANKELMDVGGKYGLNLSCDHGDWSLTLNNGEQLLPDIRSELNQVADRAIGGEEFARDMLLNLAYHKDEDIRRLAASRLASIYSFHPQDTAAAAVELVRLLDGRVSHDEEAIKYKLTNNKNELDRLVLNLPEAPKVIINVGIVGETARQSTTEYLKQKLEEVGVVLKSDELNPCDIFRRALSELRNPTESGSRDETVDTAIRLLEERIQLLTLASKGKGSTISPPPIISVLARVGLEQLKSEKSRVLDDPAYGNVKMVIEGMWENVPDLSETAKVDPSMLNLQKDNLNDSSLRAHYAGVITVEPDDLTKPGGPLVELVEKHSQKPDMNEGLVDDDTNSVKTAPTIFNVMNKDNEKYVTVILSGRTASILNTCPGDIHDLKKHDDFVTKLYQKFNSITTESDREVFFEGIDRINYKSPEIYDSKDENNIYILSKEGGSTPLNLWLIPDGNFTIKKEKEGALTNSDGNFGMYLYGYLENYVVAGNSTNMVRSFLEKYDGFSNEQKLIANRETRIKLLAGTVGQNEPVQNDQ